MSRNLILETDSYKASHFLQYPPHTMAVNSYIEARGGGKEVVFFGLQMLLKEWEKNPITMQHIDEAEALMKAHGVPFNREGWERIVTHHEGRLPVIIEALPEGTIAPVLTPLVQISNTDPELPWLTSYLETALLRAVWYPTSVATNSREAKKIIYKYLVDTADNPAAEIMFKLHDFGGRGVSSGESAAIGGLAHLVNFMGSDTVEALVAGQRYYSEPMAAFSIPAAEHSTITSWGKEGELSAYYNMIQQFSKPNSLYAVVSDSYDIYNACENLWGGELKESVIEAGGTLVIRPDSGDPVEVTLKVMNILEKKFGCTINTKGFKVLPPYLRIIQGDGVNLTSIEAILETFKSNGYSASNIAFGMGGALLQKVDRDTYKFAMKASSAFIRGDWIDVFKDPITDKGKASKKGRLAVILKDGVLTTAKKDDTLPSDNKLKIVFKDGRLLSETTLAQVRERASHEFN